MKKFLPFVFFALFSLLSCQKEHTTKSSIRKIEYKVNRPDLVNVNSDAISYVAPEGTCFDVYYVEYDRFGFLVYEQYMYTQCNYGSGGGSTSTTITTKTETKFIKADASITNNPIVNCIYQNLMNPNLNNGLKSILSAFNDNNI